MYKHILIATDGSEFARKAVNHGMELAKALGSKCTVVTASEPWPVAALGDIFISFPIDEYEKGAAENAASILSAVNALAKGNGVACDTLYLKGHYPAEGIIDAAAKRDCDLIVMASHGRRGLTRMLLGSEANKVVTYSTIPVLICR